MSNKYKKIDSIIKADLVTDGAGVSIERAFGFKETPRLDPFLLLDHFHSGDPTKYMAGFPWHPHRGIDTITYILRGSVEHSDSIGNKGIIKAGDIQWMTAGSGIIHQEMPQLPEGDDKSIGGFQLWANLPANDKMTPPRYRNISKEMIPTVTLAGDVTAKVICGTLNRTTGPVAEILIEPVYLHVSMPPKTVFTHEVAKGHTSFTYIFSGSAFFSPDSSRSEEKGTVVLFERAGKEILIRSGTQGAQYLLVSGRPLNEPIAWRGPIVMNTDEEIQIAFKDYENGTFIK